MEGNGEPRELALLSESRRLLTEAQSIDEVKLIRDRAQALRAFMKQQGESLEAQNAATEIRIRAERRAGELVRAMIEAGELRGRGGDRKSKSNDSILKLSDLGLSSDESMQWQRIASIPDKVFENHISDTKESGAELTTAGVLRLARGESSPFPHAWTLDEAAESLRRQVWLVSWKWPRSHIGIMVALLRGLADELAEQGEIRS